MPHYAALALAVLLAASVTDSAPATATAEKPSPSSGGVGDYSADEIDAAVAALAGSPPVEHGADAADGAEDSDLSDETDVGADYPYGDAVVDGDAAAATTAVGLVGGDAEGDVASDIVYHEDDGYAYDGAGNEWADETGWTYDASPATESPDGSRESGRDAHWSFPTLLDLLQRLKEAAEAQRSRRTTTEPEAVRAQRSAAEPGTPAAGRARRAVATSSRSGMLLKMPPVKNPKYGSTVHT